MPRPRWSRASARSRTAEPIGRARTTRAGLPAAVTPSAQALLEAVEQDGAVDLGGSGAGPPEEIWAGYADQPSARIVHLGEARERALGNGALIAVIDSAIDTAHPVLAGRLVEGWDFIRGAGRDLVAARPRQHQSTMAKLDQSTMAILDRRTRAVLRGVGDFEAVAVDAVHQRAVRHRDQ